MQAVQLSICYESKIPVSISKNAALVNLGGKDTIPEQYHGYFMDLPTDSSKKDKITCPGSDEEAEHYANTPMQQYFTAVKMLIFR